ncbi:unnamed protein product, partial [Oppiella nova]
TSLLLNEKIKNNFDSLELIGSGSFGEVYKVRQKATSNFYAIKITELRPAAIKELQLLTHVQSVFVVKLESFWSENCNIFIQMEYCHENLKNVLESRHAAFNRDRNTLIKLIEGVNYLHKMNLAVIHRDLKPDNILISYNTIDTKRFIKLADFGLATYHAESNMEHTEGVGAPAYTPYEVYNGVYGSKRDIYSLGVIGQKLFEIEFNG